VLLESGKKEKLFKKYSFDGVICVNSIKNARANSIEKEN
jgi:hypothetical protein